MTKNFKPEDKNVSGDSKLEPQRIRWTPELVDRFWEGFSQTRLTAFSFSKQAGHSLIIAIDHLLPRQGRILDFGAGDGYLVRLLCERGYHTAAFEPSNARSEKLEHNLRDCPTFLGVVNGNTKELFDLVIMAEVIEHILDEHLDDTLRTLAKLTRPDGLLVVTTPNNEDLDLGMAYCPVSNTLFHRWQHVRSFTSGSLSALFSQYGFDEIATHHLSFADALFVPRDPFEVQEADKKTELPSHIQELRANRPVRIGAETNLLYVGKRRS